MLLRTATFILSAALLLACRSTQRSSPESSTEGPICASAALDTTGLGARVMFVADGVVLMDSRHGMEQELAKVVVTGREITHHVRPAHSPDTTTVVWLTTRPRTSRDSPPCPISPERGVPPDSWLYTQTPRCGEVRGRVIDARTQLPRRDVAITIDGTSARTVTDSTGLFLLRWGNNEAPFATVRVEHDGDNATAELARPSRGYVVEFQLAAYTRPAAAPIVGVREVWRCEQPRPGR